jgi:hypothetical protein
VETIGYGARSINASKTPNWTLVVYIIETLFILLAPALLAASIYMVLGRIVRLLDAGHLSWVPPRWLTKLFVAGDVLSFVTQLAGKPPFVSLAASLQDLFSYLIIRHDYF